MGLTNEDILEMKELLSKKPMLSDEELVALERYMHQKAYDEAMEQSIETPRDIHEGVGHPRMFNREKREKNFGKKQHKKNKQIKKSRARNRK